MFQHVNARNKYTISVTFLYKACQGKGYAMAQLFEALRYKPEGRGFDSRWYLWNFSLT